NPCPLTLVPGNAGSVFITGVAPGNTANNAFFNGVFSANVTSSTTFTYVVNSTASDSGAPATGKTATVFYSKPDEIFPLSATAQGVAINPITNTAAIADANAACASGGSQIDLLSSLVHSFAFLIFFGVCTAYRT